MRILTTFAAMAISTTAAFASPITINFDVDQADYTVLPQFTEQVVGDQFASLGILIRDASGLGAVVDDRTGGAGSDPVHLYGNDGSGNADTTPEIDFFFVDVLDSAVAAVTDFFEILVTDGGNFSGTTLTAFDVDDNVVGMTSTIDSSFDQILTLSGIGDFSRVRISTPDDPTGYDDIVFNAVRAIDDGPAPVPLPAGGLLLLSAFGAAAAVGRRKRKS